jgi:hypothetical protein
MLTSITCDVCKMIFTSQFVIDEWGNKSHSSHKGVSIQHCDSCGRIISENTSKGFQKIHDGRTICKICLGSAIIRANEAEQQKNRVLNLLKKYSFKNIPESFSLEIVDAHKMSSISKSPLYSIRGLAQSGFSFSILGGRQSHSHKVLMLSHLPKEEFVAVLAHEILHLWINNNNVTLSEEDTEGFCNLGSYLVFFKNNSKFSNIQLKRMEKDMNPAYGKAYRKMRTELLKYGWKGFLNKIQKTT